MPLSFKAIKLQLVQVKDYQNVSWRFLAVDTLKGDHRVTYFYANYTASAVSA